MKPSRHLALAVVLLLGVPLQAAELATAENTFSVKLPPPAFPTQLLGDSPFGTDPETKDPRTVSLRRGVWK